jgi:hypothetical protein
MTASNWPAITSHFSGQRFVIDLTLILNTIQFFMLIGKVRKTLNVILDVIDICRGSNSGALIVGESAHRQ